MTHVRGSALRKNRKTVIGNEEFQEMLSCARQIEDKFFRLRAMALFCLLRICGKRRGEVAILERDDFNIEDGLLHVTFTLEKKRKDEVLQ